jgi:2-keto-4-pentenoate hydratase/2-oxohepta-3-ene-1,7-dioic acid hydratase in catechol pathway
MMKIVTYKKGKELRAGVVVDNHVLDIRKMLGRDAPETVIGLILGGKKEFANLVRAIGSVHSAKPRNATVGSASRVRLAAPIPHPGKILALAGNYEEHIRESGREFAKKDKVTPRVFIKPATCVAGPGDTVPIPGTARFIDWEGELGVVIGRKAKNIQRGQALRYVFGYTIIHDVSERRLQIRKRDKSEPWDKFFDWLNGKWGDGFAPMGPWVVTREDIPDPRNLDITTRVNGKVEQDGNTGQMIFDVADIVSYTSHLCTLEPGDVIATGTPAGVGHGKNKRLKDGDVVEIEIEGIGTLKNRFREQKGRGRRK